MLATRLSIVVVAICVLLLFPTAAVSQILPVDCTVTVLYWAPNATCQTAGDSCVDAQSAIDACPIGGTVCFGIGFTNVDGTLHVNKSLRLLGLSGESTVLYGNGKDRILSISGRDAQEKVVQVTIEGLLMFNGFAGKNTSGGGCVFVEDVASVMLKEVVLTKCYAEGSTGVYYNELNATSVLGSFGGGCLAIVDVWNITIYSSVFEQCGVMSADLPPNEETIGRVITQGGAISIAYASPPPQSVVSPTVTLGQGVDVEHAVFFEANFVRDAESGSEGEGEGEIFPSYRSFGGALSITVYQDEFYNISIDLENCRFRNGSVIAATPMGGCLSFLSIGAYSFAESIFTVDHCAFLLCETVSYYGSLGSRGGAMSFLMDSWGGAEEATIYIINSEFFENVAVAFDANSAGVGGAVSLSSPAPQSFNDGNVVIYNCTFVDNAAPKGFGGGVSAIITGEASANYMFFDVSWSTFQLNSVPTGTQGGGAAVSVIIGGENSGLAMSVFVKHCSFDSNTAMPAASGGALNIIIETASEFYIIITSSTFMNNSIEAIGFGGAVVVDIRQFKLGATFEVGVSHCLFFANSITSFRGETEELREEGGVGNGGALQIRAMGEGSGKETRIVIIDCIFEDNIARATGGAVSLIWKGRSSGLSVNVSVEDSYFKNNLAQLGQGGSVACDFFGGDGNGDGGTAFVQRNAFIGNTAGSDGGGALSISYFVIINVAANTSAVDNKGAYTIEQCHFENNSALNAAATSGGGAILILNGETALRVRNSTFTFNRVVGGIGGGAVAALFSSNFATGPDVLFENVRFVSNAVSGPLSRGGSIVLHGATAVFSDCSFVDSVIDTVAASNGAASDIAVFSSGMVQSGVALNNTYHVVSRPAQASTVDGQAENSENGGRDEALPVTVLSFNLLQTIVAEPLLLSYNYINDSYGGTVPVAPTLLLPFLLPMESSTRSYLVCPRGSSLTESGPLVSAAPSSTRWSTCFFGYSSHSPLSCYEQIFTFSATCTPCASGSFGLESGNTEVRDVRCTECPASLFCPGGSDVWVLSGKWLNTRALLSSYNVTAVDMNKSEGGPTALNASLELFVHECPAGYCCETGRLLNIEGERVLFTGCAALLDGRSSGAECGEGREGVLCGQCSQNYSQTLRLRCVPNTVCSTSMTWQLPVFSIAIFVGGVLYSLYKILSKPSNSPFFKSITFFASAAPVLYASTPYVEGSSQALKALLGTIIAIVNGGGFTTSASSSTVAVTSSSANSSSSTLTSDISKGASLGFDLCLWPGATMSDALALSYLLPVIAIVGFLAVLACHLMVRCVRSTFAKGLNDSPKSHVWRAKMKSFWTSSPSLPSRSPWGLHYSMAVYGIVMTTYSTLLDTTFKFLSCETVQTESGIAMQVMLYAGSKPCWRSSVVYTMLSVLAVCILFGWPITLLFLHHKYHRKRIARRRTIERRSLSLSRPLVEEQQTDESATVSILDRIAAVLSSPYRPGYSWWESTFYLRRWGFAILNVFIVDQILFSFLSSGLLLTLLLTHAVLRPFNDMSSTVVEATSLSLLTLLSIGGGMQRALAVLPLRGSALSFSFAFLHSISSLLDNVQMGIIFAALISVLLLLLVVVLRRIVRVVRQKRRLARRGYGSKSPADSGSGSIGSRRQGLSLQSIVDLEGGASSPYRRLTEGSLENRSASSEEAEEGGDVTQQLKRRQTNAI